MLKLKDNIKCLVIIPCKLDSVRLPLKNIQKIEDKTLLEYSIDYAIKSKYVKKIIISSEDKDNIIQNIILKYSENKEYNHIDWVFHKRSELFLKDIEIVDVYKDILINSLNKDETYNYVIGLQPDHPDRNIDIDIILDYMIDKKYDDIFTVEPNGVRSGSVRIFKFFSVFKGEVSKRVGSVIDSCTDIHTLNDLKTATENIMYIPDKYINNSVKTIAEIGWNHMGDMELAKNMIYSAYKNGAYIVKFQTWSTERLKEGPWDEDGRLDIYKKAELTLEKHKELFDYCNSLGVKFMSSVFSIEDAKLLLNISNEYIKIPSFEIYNDELLYFAFDNFKNIFVSTGTSNIEEIHNVLNIYDNYKQQHNDIGKRLILLHCVSSYPLNPKEANLNRIKIIYEDIIGDFYNNIKNNISLGYSDHCEGIDIAKMSLQYNIEFIEKHFTLSHHLPGRDNKFAILPHELKQLNEYININDYIKYYSNESYQQCEEESRLVYRGRFNRNK